jgi:hypothetical protein
VSAQFGAEIPAFTKPAFERLRRSRHAAQYFDPSAAPLTESDAIWAIRKAKDALSAVKALLTATPPGAVQLAIRQGQPEQGAACDRVVEGAGSRLQPVGVADGGLYRPGQALLGGAEGGIELVPVGFVEDKHVDVPYRPLAGLSRVSGRP